MITLIKGLLVLAVLAEVVMSSECTTREASYDARKMLSQIDWVSVTSLSTKAGIEGYPMGNLKSISDGPAGNATGIPYFFTSDVDISCQDYLVDNRATVFATMASTDYCRNNGFDPQDPRCPRLFLTGTYMRVEDEEEKNFAMIGLIEKHPEMKVWAELPDFYVSKLNIQKIIYLGTYGPTSDIPVDEYLAVKLN